MNPDDLKNYAANLIAYDNYRWADHVGTGHIWPHTGSKPSPSTPSAPGPSQIKPKPAAKPTNEEHQPTRVTTAHVDRQIPWSMIEKSALGIQFHRNKLAVTLQGTCNGSQNDIAAMLALPLEWLRSMQPKGLWCLRDHAVSNSTKSSEKIVVAVFMFELQEDLQVFQNNYVLLNKLSN